MMILMDYNQVMLASLFMSIGNHHNIGLEEDLIRHMFLNSLRSNRKKFKDEFGEMVICADGRNTWRREIFPYYKAGRRKAREESDMDWGELFRIMGKILDELKEFFPYKVIHIDECEADDIIGTIIHEFGTELNTGTEPFLILSGDKDYIQLHMYANVKQFDPVRKKWIQNSNPDKYLKEHIIRGDGGDGVPNILSADNTFAVGERQKPITQKRLSALLENSEAMDTQTAIRFNRNKMMIDLSEVPQKLKGNILEEFKKEKNFGRSKLFNFFVEKRLKNLLTDIQDF